MNLFHFISKEKELKMIWKIKRDGKESYLAGTAHFFPYKFRSTLRKHISNVDTVLLEGPLEEGVMNMVVEQSSGKTEFPSLYDALDARTIIKINKELGYLFRGTSSFMSYMESFKKNSDLLYSHIKDQSPWMAFFSIWFHFLKKRGWRYTMDLDALNAAKELGRKVFYLEKIEEQIEALNGIPFERIVNFVKKIEYWDGYVQRYVKLYLRGDFEEMMNSAVEFPTRCESIIGRRDPILYERMKVFLEKGNALVAIGITHMQGIKKMLSEDGYLIHKL
ncbi:MAG: TraB/GumN family protein [Candidatus Mariimomonas ferrooxydans]